MRGGAVHQCDVLTLAGLACTSLYGETTAAKVVEERWKDLIKSFAPDMQATTFLAVMRETNTTLVGGAAVVFLEEAPFWKLRNINFVCGRHGYENFCIVLIEKLHGTVVNNNKHPNNDPTYLSYQTRGVIDRCVIVTDYAIFDILCSSTVTPLTPLIHSYSTHLMISVSADVICIAYPSAFFDRIGTVQTGERSDAVEQGIKKWRERGFFIADNGTDLIGGECKCLGYCPRASRFFGDEHCLTFYFRNALVMTGCGGTFNAEYRLEPAWTAGWIFGGEPCTCDTCEGKVPNVSRSG